MGILEESSPQEAVPTVDDRGGGLDGRHVRRDKENPLAMVKYSGGLTGGSEGRTHNKGGPPVDLKPLETSSKAKQMVVENLMDSSSKEAGDVTAYSNKKAKKCQENEGVPKDRQLDRVGATKITENDLNLLQKEGVFSGTKWWVPRSEERFIHGRHSGTIMALHSWFDAGLCVPIHPLISALMSEYGFDLAHLHPMSILRVNIFRWLCETVLGQAPTLTLLLHFFEASINHKAVDLLFGSVELKFHKGMAKRYPISPSTSPDQLWKDWTNKWFYLALSPPFHHPGVLPNTGGRPVPSLRPVRMEKLSPKDQLLIVKLEEVRSQRSVRDMLEEMFMAGTFKMVSSTNLLGLCDSICPPHRPNPVMSYAEAKAQANKLIGPYTTEEHKLYVKEIGCKEISNIVVKRFKLEIPLRTDPALAPQLERMANCSRETVGSSQINKVGVMPKKEVALGRAANDAFPVTSKKRKCMSSSLASDPQPATEGASTPDQVAQNDPDSLAAVFLPPVNQIMEDTCGDGNLVPALLSSIGDGKSLMIPNFILNSDDESIQDEIHVSKEKTSPGLSGSDSEDTMEWLGSLRGKGDDLGDSASVVQAVQGLAARADMFPVLIKKVEKVKKQAKFWNEAYLNSMEQLEAAERDLGNITSNYTQQKKKTGLVEEELKKTILGAEQIQRSLKITEDKVVTLEKEKENLQTRTNVVEEELIETSKQAKISKEALADMRILVNTLKEDLRISKEKTAVPPEPVGPQAEGEVVTAVEFEAEVASRIHSLAQEVHQVLKGLQANGLTSPPPPPTVSEACKDLAILVERLEEATRIYSRTLAVHTLALGVATVVDKNIGWAGLQGKVPATAKALLKKEDGLLIAATKFVQTRDPNKAASI